MSRVGYLVECAFMLLLCEQLLGAPWDTVVFEDRFDGPALDLQEWVINHPGHWWWVQGRTHFPDPETTAGPFAHVEDGACVIEHHRYNPYHLGTPKTTFLGGEIRSKMDFTPDKAYRFEARVRNHAYPDGLVTSFFLYGWDGAASDETDDEFVSKQTNDDAAWPDGDPVLTNTWNESQQWPAYVAPPGLALPEEWQTFRIYWYPQHGRVVWTWMDPAGGETHLRTDEASSHVPDENMNLYFNFWASGPSWPDAYSADLQPAQVPGDDETYLYEIDYVQVCTPEPATVLMLAAGAGCLLGLRRRER